MGTLADLAAKVDLALHGFDDAAGGGEAQAAAAGAGGEVGLEELLLGLGGDAGASIGDGEGEVVRVCGMGVCVGSHRCGRSSFQWGRRNRWHVSV